MKRPAKIIRIPHSICICYLLYLSIIMVNVKVVKWQHTLVVFYGLFVPPQAKLTRDNKNVPAQPHTAVLGDG